MTLLQHVDVGCCTCKTRAECSAHELAHLARRNTHTAYLAQVSACVRLKSVYKQIVISSPFTPLFFLFFFIQT
jgi:hypothetical protein